MFYRSEFLGGFIPYNWNAGKRVVDLDWLLSNLRQVPEAPKPEPPPVAKNSFTVFEYEVAPASHPIGAVKLTRTSQTPRATLTITCADPTLERTGLGRMSLTTRSARTFLNRRDLQRVSQMMLDALREWQDDDKGPHHNG